jgi:SAM-dependent methyltransferase
MSVHGSTSIRDDVRFAFGDNWRRFLNSLNQDRIAEAEQSLSELLGHARLNGFRFLDIGSGSGLFSLAARRLGAEVRSFDFDPASVACTNELRRRFFPDDPKWVVEHGSILDPAFTATLGSIDIVYSWGVLHHTGAMQTAIEQAAAMVKPDGLFAFALYRKTLLCGPWRRIKRWYAAAPLHSQRRARAVYIALRRIAHQVRGCDFHSYIQNYYTNRGMNFVHDVHDWMGGYPYESISPAEVAEAMAKLGFEHVRSITGGHSIGMLGSGCDEYVYQRK